MRRHAPTLSTVGLFLAIDLWAGPVSIPGSDPRTLLRVHSTLREEAQFVQRVDIDRLITRGGGLISIASAGLEELRPEAFAASGRGLPADLAALGQALAAGPVGMARDCTLNSGGRTGTAEITWYGRNGRRNRFTLLFVDSEPAESDRCPATTREIWDAIEIFEEQAFRNP